MSDNSDIKIVKEKKKFSPVLILIIAIVVIVIIVVAIVLITKAERKEEFKEQMHLADDYLGSGDFERATDAYRAAIDIDPKNVKAYLTLADAYIDEGDYASAIDILEDGADATNSKKIEKKLDEVKDLYRENNGPRSIEKIEELREKTINEKGYGLQEGKIAAEIGGENQSGDKIVLEDNLGKVTVLCFYTSWCPYCQDEMELINELYDGIDEEVSFAMINIAEDWDTIDAFSAEYGIEAPVYRVDSWSDGNYTIESIPTILVINDYGMVEVVFDETASVSDIETAISKAR